MYFCIFASCCFVFLYFCIFISFCQIIPQMLYFCISISVFLWFLKKIVRNLHLKSSTVSIVCPFQSLGADFSFHQNLNSLFDLGAASQQICVFYLSHDWVRCNKQRMIDVKLSFHQNLNSAFDLDFASLLRERSFISHTYPPPPLGEMQQTKGFSSRQKSLPQYIWVVPTYQIKIWKGKQISFNSYDKLIKKFDKNIPFTKPDCPSYL